MLIRNGFLIYTLIDYEKSLFCWKIREEKGNVTLNIGAASCEQAVRTGVISLSSDARATRHTRLPCTLLEYIVIGRLVSLRPFPFERKKNRLLVALCISCIKPFS